MKDVGLNLKNPCKLCEKLDCCKCEEIIKYEKHLERKRKYKIGGHIKSFDDCLNEEFIYIGEKIYHRGWFMSFQVNLLNNLIKRNLVNYAIKKEK